MAGLGVLSFGMADQEGQDVFDYEFDEDSGTVSVNMLGSIYGPSLEDYPRVMSRVVNVLQEVPEAQSVVLSESREYEYGDDQARMLKEIAQAIKDISGQGFLSETGNSKCAGFYQENLPEVQRIVVDQMRKDPIGAFVELKRMRRHLQQDRQSAHPQRERCIKYFINEVVDPVYDRLSECSIIQQADEGDYLTGHHVGDREIYREFFHPVVRPNFMLTKYMSLPPDGGEEVDRYTVMEDVEVSVYDVPGQVQPVYHIDPPEFRLSEEKYQLLDTARRFLASHQPESGEFARPDRMRQVFQNIGGDMLRDIANRMDVRLTADELDQLTDILNRYTSGLGVLELLLADEQVQDIYMNSPIGSAPIHIKHMNYDECRTNLIPTRDEAESYATRFRIKSGRPLDEANPVLDTDTQVPGGRARVAIVQENLSPDGLAFAFRRHRSKAWTFPLFMNNDMMNGMAAGLLSFLIDGNRAMLFSGTRGAGKSSLLGAALLEILKKHRIITVEDSVTGDSTLLYRESGQVRRGTMGELVDPLVNSESAESHMDRDVCRDTGDLEVLSMSDGGDLRWSDVSMAMRHEVDKDIYEVETRTGRSLKVTEDHSLFTMGEGGGITEIEPTDLEEGSFVVTPRRLMEDGEHTDWNLADRAASLEGYFTGDMELDSYRERLKTLATENGWSEHIVQHWVDKPLLPAEIFDRVQPEHTGNLQYKHKRQSHLLPAEIRLDETMMEFLGLWMADGCYDSRSVLVTVSNQECREVVRAVHNRFGIETKHHSDGHTLIANCQPLKEVMKEHELEHGSHEKRVPEWVYSSSQDQRTAFLRGFFSGDGYATEDEVGVDLVNAELVSDIQTLLLMEGIRGRARDSGKMRSMRVSDLDGIRRFQDRIGFLQERKRSLPNTDRESTHDSTDVVPLPRGLLEEACGAESVESYDYLERGYDMGRQKLKQISGSEELSKSLESLADSDIFWDQVRSVEKVSEEAEVYDLSVPGDQNFVTENVLAHNTLELPVRQMKDLGFNLESLKAQSVITDVASEMSADQAIRTSLRLGDSALVVGEVRSDEAQALYEAMRVGAAANFVGGTIHGEDAFSVYDRVVNDLGVPSTSFKATDIIVSANKIKSPDGLETYRRVTGITEVRKDWMDNPRDGNGFVDLMRYDSNEDELVPTDTFLNGESIVLQRIAENIRGYKNNWGKVLNDIKLRKKVKEEIVRQANDRDMPELMEAEFTVQANEQMHILSENVHEEYGEQDTERVFARWKEWMDQQVT
nr:MAG: type II/IV secretion system protein [Candidatus Nanosalinarum sp. J07AB56]